MRHAAQVLVSVLLVSTMAARADAGTIDPLAFQWATIGDPGNAPYEGNVLFWSDRGSVPYEYRISRLETTTAQWDEFLNSVKTYDRFLALNMSPVFWGGGLDANDNFVVGPGDAARYPVGGISWRTAAMYVNWLHNDKANERWAIEDGAYDTSTFGTDGLHFTDQPTHHPDAKYWIPTLDEQIKAFHYDPDRYGEGQPGWWAYSTSSDTQPIGGAPGVGETSAGWLSTAAWATALGSYENVQSPWGLWDTSGGASELNELIFFKDGHLERGLNGFAAQQMTWNPGMDHISTLGSVPPSTPFAIGGFRIASRVPEPGVVSVVSVFASSLSRRRRRDETAASGRRSARRCGWCRLQVERASSGTEPERRSGPCAC